MKSRFSWRRTFLIAAFALVCAISLGGGMLLALLSGRTAPDDVFAEEPPVAAPFREYTAIEVDYVAGFEGIYKGVTTVRGLKNNLVVRGTVNSEGNFTESETFVLLYDEYVLKIGGETKADGYTLLESTSEATSLAVTVSCGELSIDITPTAIAAPEGTVSSIEIKMPDSITDDHTAESLLLESAFQVIDKDTGAVLRNDRYNVVLNYSGNKALVVVSVIGGNANASIEVPVTPATPVGVDLRPASDLVREGALYKRYVDGIAYDAFVVGATPEDIFGNLVVTAVYPNSRRPLQLSYDSQHALEAVASWAGRSDRTETVSTNVRLADDSATVRDVDITLGAYRTSLSINFAARTIVKIEVNETAFKEALPLSLNAYTVLNVNNLAGAVKLWYNTGLQKDSVVGEDIEIVGTLAPTAEVLRTKPETYPRNIQVRSTANNSVISEEIEISGIKFDEPKRVSSDINGNIAPQTMHHEFDYSGLSVTFIYDDRGRNTVVANLEDFRGSNYIETTLYEVKEEGSTATGSTVVTKDTKEVDIKFVYGSFETYPLYGSVGDATLTVNKDPVTAPALDTNAMYYSQNCNKTIAMNELSYGAVSLGHAYNMSVSVYDTQEAATNNGTASENAKWEGNVLGGNGTVSFTSGGTFWVKVALQDDTVSNEEYELRYTGTNSNIIVDTNGRYVLYRIVVNKGTIAVSPDPISDKLYYGDAVTPVVKGTVGGVTYTLINSTDGGAVGAGELAVPFQFVYEPANNDAYDPTNDEYAYGSYDVTTKDFYNKTTKCLNAGTYHVYVVTAETKAYLASKSRAGKYAEVTVNPKELNLSNPASPTYEQGVSRGASDFIVASNFVSPDDADAVLSVIDKGTNTPFEAKTHRGEYEVTVQINSAYQNNYVLVNGANKVNSVDLTFEITQLTLKFDSAWASGFTYGTAGANPNPGYRKKDEAHFYANVVLDGYYYYGTDGNSTAVKMTEPYDFSKWEVGYYAVKYTTDYANADERTYEDYTLPEITSPKFQVTAGGISKISVTENNWTTGTPGGTVGRYSGTAIETVLNNWPVTDADNTAPDGSKIITVKIDGVYSDGTAFTLTHDGTNKFAVTDAGVYTVTVSLNKNYIWNGDGNRDDIVYYGTVKKAVLSDLALSDNTTYNGSEQEQHITFKVNGGASTWTKNALEITSVVGTSAAADGATLGGDRINSVNGTFKVVSAGKYTVTVTLIDANNYEWSDDTASAVKTAEYTVYQAPLIVRWNNTDYTGGQYPEFDFDEGASEQAIPAYAPWVAVAGDRGSIALTGHKIYSDAVCTQEVGTKVTAAGTYYIKITAFEYSGNGQNIIENYLPVEENELKNISIKFVVSSKGLTAPELTAGGNTVSVFYGDGSHGTGSYLFSDFIKNFDNNYLKNGNSRIVITVWNDAMISGNDPLLKDVYWKDGAVKTYAVSVTPAANYKWKEGQYTNSDTEGKTFYLEIKQRVVSLTWENGGVSGNFVYDGTTEYKPSVTFDNKLSGDNIALTVSGGTTQAGVHTASVALSGTAINNYTLSGVTTTCSFTVKKAVLAAPVMESGTFTYDERSQTITYQNWAARYNGKITATVVGSNTLTGVPAEYRTLANFSFDNATGGLTFVHAGTYTVTFSLTEEARKNYCWTEAGQTAFTSGVEVDGTAQNITVNRKELTAPALGAERAIEYGKGTAPASIQSGNAVQGIKYTVSYGTYADGSGFSAATNKAPETVDRVTVYYVKLTIDKTQTLASLNGATFSPYDYVWVDNPDDSKASSPGMSYLVNEKLKGVYGGKEYIESGVSMMLCYVITLKQVGADFDFDGYTFGDNGFQDGASRTFLPAGDMKFNDLLSGLRYKESSEELYKDTLLDIIKVNPTVTVEFRENNDANNPRVVPDSNIVNGLPWNQGTYYAYITVTFDSTEDLNGFSRSVAFTVTKRTVQVTWSPTDSAVYSGAEQTRGVSVANMPVKTKGGLQEAAPELVVDKYTDVKYSGTSVAAYTVNITDVNDGNYTVEGMTDKSASFTITPKEIAVIGTNVAGHVYGDAITPAEKAFTLQSGYDFCDGGTYITVDILKQDGTALPALPGVGTYRVVPRLVNEYGNYTLKNSDGESLVTEGAFEIVAREITVSIGTDANGKTLATSVYGEAQTNLNSSSVYVVTVTNGVDAGKTNGIPAGDTASAVFSLGVDKTIDTTSPITTDTNKYYVTCEDKHNSNYAVTFAADTWEYVITPAAITGVTVSGYRAEYNAANNDILSVDATAVNGMTLKWSYSLDGTDWTLYKEGDGAAKKQIRNVDESENYYVKVEAENHAPYILDDTVKVEVWQATLRVSVNMTVLFGEVGPDMYSGTQGVWYQSALADLRTDGSIYTVTGFKGNDGGAAERALFYNKSDAFYGLQDGFSYNYLNDSADRYTAGKDIGTYGLTFIVSGLDSTNYKFVGGEGYLTVEALPVVVDIGDCTAVYNAPNPAQPDVASVVTERKSSYDKTSPITLGISTPISKTIVTISHEALNPYEDGVTTNKVGTYNIGIVINNANYVLDEDAANGGYETATYEITSATNTITTAAMNSLFTQAFSTDKVENLTENANAWVYGNYHAQNAPDGYSAGGKQALNDLAMLCNEKALTVTLYVGTEGTETLGTVLTIPAGTSGADATVLLKNWFEGIYNGGAFGAKTYRISYHMDETTNYNEFNRTLYFKVGQRALVITPTSISSLEYGSAVPEYRYNHTPLVTNGNGNGAAEDVLGDIVDFKFSSTYAASYANGSVGSYDITAGNIEHKTLYDNYAVTFNEGTLTVMPRAITIQIIDETHHYNFIGAYDAANERYRTENFNDGYKFKLISGQFASYDCPDKEITETEWQDGVSVGVQTVFTLNSDAILTLTTTNNQGIYPVYLMGHYAGAKGECNYAITVKEPTFNKNDELSRGDVPADALVQGVAGKHTIERARIHVSVAGPYKNYNKDTDEYSGLYAFDDAERVRYDGNQKYYKVDTKLPNGVTVGFSSKYYQRNASGSYTIELADAPKNAGYYQARFATDDDNYIAQTTSETYQISQRALTQVSSKITNASNPAEAVTGSYDFNGAAYTYAWNFGNFVGSEGFNATESVVKTLKKAGPSDKETFMAGDGDVITGGYAYTATNAGEYAVTITLADGDNGFLAANYAWYDTASGRFTDKFTFTLDIGLKQLTVSTAAASVQYGDSLADASFTGMKPVYFVDGTNAETAGSVANALLTQEITAHNLTLPLAIGATTTNKSLFDTDYSVTSSAWGGRYKLQLKESTITAYNFEVVYADGVETALSIAARKMEITVKGYNDGVTNASCTYDGQGVGHNGCLESFLNTYSNRTQLLAVTKGDLAEKPSDYRDPLMGVSLAVSNEVSNVSSLRMRPTTKNGFAMYSITFMNAAGEVITASDSSENNEKLPTWEILQKTLTIHVGYYDGGVFKQDIHVPYGSTLTFGTTFTLNWEGFIEGEGTANGPTNAFGNGFTISECTVLDGSDNAYKEWKSNAGETFTVLPVLTAGGTTLSFLNYKIELDGATLTVDKLTVTAEANPVKYTALGTAESPNYNGGVSGIEHNVDLVFTGVEVALTSAASQFNYASVRYSTGANDAAAAGRAPTKAGEYTAYVTLAANGNYQWANGVTEAQFTHVVEKREFNLTWEHPSVVMQESATKANNTVNYINSMMTMVSFNYQRSDNTSVDISDPENYTVTDDRSLFIEVDRLGSYELTVDFTSAAARNYYWSADDTKQALRYSVSFTLTSSNRLATIEIHASDVMYRDAIVATSTLKNAAGSVISGAVITYTYASLGTSTEFDTSNRLLDASQASSKNYTAALPQNVGWYIIRASYGGSAEYASANAYYLIQITKRTVNEVSFSSSDTVYKGTQLTATAGYDTEVVYVVSFDGESYAPTSGGSILRATNARTYTVVLGLRNGSNYAWASESSLPSGATLDSAANTVSFSWTVNQAKDNKIIWDNGNIYEITYGGTYVVNARSTYSNSVQIRYAVKGSAAWQDIPESQWMNVRQSNAGSYYVRVTSEGNANYVQAVDCKEITIHKATLTVTPTGTLIYGQAFDAGEFGYVSSVAGVVIERDQAAQLQYQLADGSLDKDKLDANTYALTMLLNGDGFVSGLKSTNYNIALANGTLRVSPREVAVQIGSKTGVYLEEITLGGVNIRVIGEWDSAQNIDVLGITLSTNARFDSSVGSYDITGSATNGNYAVTFRNGTYTIVPLQVRVEISAGGGIFGGKITAAEVEHVYTVNASEVTDLGKDALTFTYRYTGSSNGGTAYNSNLAPELAGTYIATVTGIADNGNYALSGVASVPFVVAKQEIKAGEFNVPSQAYANKALTPEIEANGFEDLFTVVPHGEFIDAGTHTFYVRLNDFNNYKWQSVDVAERELQFVITKAQNSLVGADPSDTPTISIEGWQYGRYNAAINKPWANTAFGSQNIVYEFATSPDDDAEWTNAIPANGNAGTYWVRVTVAGSDNYEPFVSAPVAFVIGQVAIDAPTLVLNESNRTYTGSELSVNVLGVDNMFMEIYFESIAAIGGGYQLKAINAGTYLATVLLKDSVNYRWADGTDTDGDGNAVLTWIIARKKIAVPKAGNALLFANGGILTYLPEGFDNSIMSIAGNEAGYGGDFTATVSLIDTQNFEWEDGSIGSIEFKWSIVGANTVFVIVISVLSGASGIAAAIAAGQYVLFRKKRTAEAEGPQIDDAPEEGESEHNDKGGEQA